MINGTMLKRFGLTSLEEIEQHKLEQNANKYNL